MLLGDLRRLAHETYLELNLGSLIRLDVRADADGKLHVLEANPKPDLKKPAAGVTSLIAAGLPELGMQYDDLILSLLADRLDFLFAHRRGMVRHLFDLLETPNLFDLMGSAASAQVPPQPDEPVALLNELRRISTCWAQRRDQGCVEPRRTGAHAPPRPSRPRREYRGSETGRAGKVGPAKFSINERLWLGP